MSQPTIKCPNGHSVPANGAKFCIHCGVPIAVQQAPLGHQPPPQYSQVPQHVIGGTPKIEKCSTCGGAGERLPARSVICRECKWLRPLVPGYRVEADAFAWAADAKAMSVLRSMTPLNAAAKAVSQKVGRRWIEVTFNGILLGEKQLPQIYSQAVIAARILGMSHMPDIYISGERPWDCHTFGSEDSFFIVIGSALAGNFQGKDMLYLLARELGHCKAGHALWNTVIRFFLGEQGQSRGMLSGGIFNAILSPTALVGGAIEMPLLAWARQSEITADRAGLLAVGSEEVARRVLMSWSLKSSLMYRQINLDAWLEQQSINDDGFTRLSELTVTSTPYIGPRLKLLSEYVNSPQLQHYLRSIAEIIKRSAPKNEQPKPDSDDFLRIKCSKCATPMKIPKKMLAGKTELPVKCPNRSCGAVTTLRKNAKPADGTSGKTPPPQKLEENMNYGD